MVSSLNATLQILFCVVVFTVVFVVVVVALVYCYLRTSINFGRLALPTSIKFQEILHLRKCCFSAGYETVQS